LTRWDGRGEKKIYSAMGSCINKATVTTQVEKVQGSRVREREGGISAVGSEK
jgi:hypothetical protein